MKDGKIICGNKFVSCYTCGITTRVSEKYKLRLTTISENGVEKIEIIYFCKKCGAEIKKEIRGKENGLSCDL